MSKVSQEALMAALAAFRLDVAPLHAMEAALEAAFAAQSSPAPELERQEVVAYLNEWRDHDKGGIRVRPALSPMSEEGLQKESGPQASVVRREPLMTVAQHDRIVGALRAECAGYDRAYKEQWEKARDLQSEMNDVVEERDASQARVAELERECCDLRNRLALANLKESARQEREEDAPVAQAGQVPEELKAKINECLTLAFEEIALYVSPDKCRDPRSRARRASALATEIRAALAAAPAQGE